MQNDEDKFNEGQFKNSQLELSDEYEDNQNDHVIDLPK